MKSSLLLISSFAACLFVCEAASAQTASATFEGTTTTMTKNADGTYTVTRKDADGNVTVKIIGKPKPGPTGISVGDGNGGWKPYNPK